MRGWYLSENEPQWMGVIVRMVGLVDVSSKSEPYSDGRKRRWYEGMVSKKRMV